MGKLACDDGNKINGDGCTFPACTIETGFNCLGGDATTGDVCYELCGDGKDFLKNQCEDGNKVSGDGCS